MSKLFIAAALATSFVAVPALACEDHKGQASLQKVTVPELAKLQAGKKVTILDANSAETRTKLGVIPGAKLLSSAIKYELSELPAEKSEKLVFYCANTQCTASHQAAKKALGAGYTDVAILPDGVAGWKAAGQSVAVPRS